MNNLNLQEIADRAGWLAAFAETSFQSREDRDRLLDIGDRDIPLLISELQKAREALAPFAAFCEAVQAMGGNYPKTGTLYAVEPKATGLREITVEHLEIARQALSPAPVGSEEPSLGRRVFDHVNAETASIRAKASPPTSGGGDE